MRRRLLVHYLFMNSVGRSGQSRHYYDSSSLKGASQDVQKHRAISLSACVRHLIHYSGDQSLKNTFAFCSQALLNMHLLIIS